MTQPTHKIFFGALHFDIAGNLSGLRSFPSSITCFYYCYDEKFVLGMTKGVRYKYSSYEVITGEARYTS